MKLGRNFGALVAIIVATFGGVVPAHAQAIVNAAGSNPTLRSLATNIVGICPPLPKVGAGDVADLGRRCSSAVNAANAGGNNAAVAGILGQIAPEELIAQDAQVSGAVQPQTRALSSRIAALGGAGPARQLTASLAALPMMQQTASDAAPTAVPVGRGGRFDAFATGFAGWGDVDATELQNGFEADSWSLLGGADYGLSDELIIGGAVGYAKTQIDFARNGGDLETKSWTLAGFASLAMDNGFYGSALAAFSWIDYESARQIRYTEVAAPSGAGNTAQTINRTARGETDATQYEIAANGGYGFQYGAVTIGPAFGVSYRKLEIDGFEESGAQGLDMRYQDQDSDSLQLSFGGDASWTLSTGVGVVSPYARAAVVYEALNDKRTLDMRYRVDPFVASQPNLTIRVQTDSPDRTRFDVGGGASVQFAGGFSGFVDVQTTLGQDDVSSYGLAFGLRREF